MPSRTRSQSRIRVPAIGRTIDVNSRQATAPVLPEGWTDLDVQAIDTVRLLAADAVQKVGNGHPGTAISLAPAAYLLFQKVMRHDPVRAALARAGTASCCPAGTRA